MAEFALLNSVDHRHVRVITERAARYGDDVMQALTFPFEFRNVQAFYPILFQQDGKGGYRPMALFGFQSRENLFLGEGGWAAGYVPAMLRRAPFHIGYQQARGAGQGEDRMRVLSLDMAHPRVARSSWRTSPTCSRPSTKASSTAGPSSPPCRNTASSKR